MNLSKFNVSTEVVIRFSDTDAMGHVNNARYFHYMEEGRVEYIRRLFPEKSMKDSFECFPFILGKIECSFRSPAFTGEVLQVNLGVTDIGNKSFTIQYELIEKLTQRIVAEGSSVLVMYDYKNHKTIPISDEFIQKIENVEGKTFRE